MDFGILILIIIILIPLIYLLYFWSNSDKLNDNEIEELSHSRRFWDIQNYFGFREVQFDVNKEFKSALNKNGQLYNFSENLSNFPGIASALLKGKKHEWIMFAYVKNKKVISFYANKGNDNLTVAPNLSPAHIIDLAKTNNADIVLQFHNHPNAVLYASSQDIFSANYLGKVINDNGINYFAFVCGSGHFHQYGWWMIENFFSLNNYFTTIQKENGNSRSVNFELRKELKRKKYFKDFRLNNNSSHNISSKLNNELAQNNLPKNKTDDDMEYLKEVLNVFKEDLNKYPTPQHTNKELMQYMGDNKNEIWQRYFYLLPRNEFGIFDNLEMIDHSVINKTFIFSTNKFSINDLENLVSIFYTIFGNDMMGKGKFDNEDRNQIVSRNFWLGRSWVDYDKYKCAVTIIFNAADPKLDLCVKW